MAQKLTDIKGGGGSIRVGTTGTVGALMSREMNSMTKQMPETSTSSRRKPQTVPVSVPCGSIPKKSQPRRNSPNEASSSGCSDDKNLGGMQKTRTSLQSNDHHIPMLGSGNHPTGKNPNRGKTDKKGPYIVEVVDIKCSSNPDNAWAAPIMTRLKKLGFSKLSETIT